MSSSTCDSKLCSVHLVEHSICFYIFLSHYKEVLGPSLWIYILIRTEFVCYIIRKSGVRYSLGSFSCLSGF